MGAEVVGLHVYAAQLHHARFQQLEGGLSPRYQQPEELARRAPCSVLVTTGESSSSLSEPEAAQAPGQVEWIAEAEARLDRVPFFARGMARKAIEDYATENGITQITPEVMARAWEHRGL